MCCFQFPTWQRFDEVVPTVVGDMQQKMWLPCRCVTGWMLVCVSETVGVYPNYQRVPKLLVKFKVNLSHYVPGQALRAAAG